MSTQTANRRDLQKQIHAIAVDFAEEYDSQPGWVIAALMLAFKLGQTHPAVEISES